MKWNTVKTKPKGLSNYKWKIYLQSRKNLPLTETISVDVKQSREILMRIKHGKTHYYLGDKGWAHYPDSQAGKYKYYLGVYRVDEDGTEGFIQSNGHEIEPDGWTYLPNCVATGYTW